MTAPGTLADPQLTAFWASDPSRRLEPAPTSEPPPPEPHRPTKAQVAEVAVALAAAFIVVRTLIAHDLENSDAPADVTGATARLWAKHAPIWLRLAVPAIARAYRLGQVSELSQAELEQMAGEYALSLGDYLNTTSVQALADGFNAQLAARWSERVAWQRARAGYGLDRQQMTAYIGGLMKAENSTEIVPEAARAMVDRALLHRADAIAETEVWRALQSGKAIVWLLQQQAGLLPGTALKEWDTLEDEATCPICGPLNRVAVPIAEYFESGEGKLFAPGAHPRCRCDLKLRIPEPREPVAKDAPGDPFNRDRHGQFASREHRGRLRLLERPTAPVAAPPTKQPLYAEPEAASALYTDSGLYRAESKESLYGKTKLYAETESALYAKPELFTSPETATRQAARTQLMPRLHIRIELPAPPAKPDPTKIDVHYFPADQVQEYFDDLFDGAIGAFDGQVHMGDIRAHLGVPTESVPYEEPWLGMEPQIQMISGHDWDEILALAVPLWDRARGEVEDVVNELDQDDLMYISAWAGYSGYQHPDLIMKNIVESVQQGDTGDDSLADAYADYVTYVRPDLLGEPGLALRGRLANADFEPDMEARPQTMFVFNKGLHPEDSPKDLRADYEITGLRYRSALGEDRGQAPRGYIGAQEYYLEPTDVDQPLPWDDPDFEDLDLDSDEPPDWS